MTTALQTPLRHADSKPVGPNVFRRQILPKDTITYEGRTMVFDDDYLERLVDAFHAGTFKQVPFVLADPLTNKHSVDPDRWRGKVKGLELTSDGLDAILELSSAGAELVRENPELGVSARILEDVERADGRRAPVAIAHVCGTLDPEIAGNGEWESLSDLSSSYGHVRLVDLTGATYRDEMAETETTPPEISEEERSAFAKLRDFFAKNPEASPPAAAPPASGSPSSEATDGLPDDLTDDEKAALAEVIETLRSEPETEPEPEPAGAALSAEAQHKIDLAAREAKQAQRDADDLRSQLAAKDFEAEKRELVLSGVPPAAVDLAKPALMHRGTIDLSHDDKVDVGKIARGLLAEMKDTIDLTGEMGSAVGGDEAKAEAEKLHKAWNEQSGEGVKVDA